MFPIHSQPNLNNNQKKYLIYEENEKQSNKFQKKKLINYSDYLKLKDAYILLQENSKKIKEENTQLNSLLSSYQDE